MMCTNDNVINCGDNFVCLFFSILLVPDVNMVSSKKKKKKVQVTKT